MQTFQSTKPVLLLLRKEEKVKHLCMKSHTEWNEGFFIIIITSVVFYRVCLFPSVSAAQSDVLCEDIWPSFLPGGFQPSIHADLDGCHCYGNRRAQPLLTFFHMWLESFWVKLLSRQCMESFLAVWDAGLADVHFRAWFCIWAREFVDNAHEIWRYRGSTVAKRCFSSDRRSSCKSQTQQPPHCTSVTP